MCVLIAGIVSAECINLPDRIFYVCYLLSIPFILFYFNKKYNFLLSLFIVFLVGAQTGKPQYIHTEPNKSYLIHCRCEEQLNGSNYILSVKGQRFYLNIADTCNQFSIGDSLEFQCKIWALADNSNEGGFSYNRYLRQKEVYYRFYPTSEIRQTGHARNLYTIFQDLRTFLLVKTDSLIKDSTQNAIVKALSLGFKNDLDNTTKSLFSTTGTIHLLAVSGLHTGALYLFISYLFNLSGLRNKRYHLLIIPILWSYACLTGLSPSVIRAACILSFIIFGNAFERNYTPLNSIAASAFFTLLLYPSTLYTISMQMSYASYCGIIILYPLLKKLPGPLPPVIAPVYSLLCVSIAAQLTTFPLCIFYFHSFSLNSFLVNIIAVPIGTLLLYSSYLLLLFPLVIGQFVAHVTVFLCGILLKTLQIFQPFSLNLSNLYPSIPDIVLIYVNLVVFCLLFIKRSKQLYRLCCTVLLITIVFNCLSYYDMGHKKEIVVFNLYRESCILLNYEGQYCFLKQNMSAGNAKKIVPYLEKNKLCSLPELQSLSAMQFQWKEYCLFYNRDTFRLADRNHIPINPSGTLIVSDNILPKHIFFHSSPLPKQVILDGSNNRFCLSEWEKFCIQHQVQLLNTNKNGTIILSLK